MWVIPFRVEVLLVQLLCLSLWLLPWFLSSVRITRRKSSGSSLVHVDPNKRKESSRNVLEEISNNGKKKRNNLDSSFDLNE